MKKRRKRKREGSRTVESVLFVGIIKEKRQVAHLGVHEGGYGG
jgi:hypothetical protein